MQTTDVVKYGSLVPFSHMTDRPTSLNRKTLILVAVHIAVGITVAAAAHLELQRPSVLGRILLVAALAVIFCQSGLVGFWAAMSPVPAWKRTTGLIAGMIVLEMMLLWCRGEFVFMPTMVTGFVAILLVLLRAFRAGILAVAHPTREFNRRTPQFSIRGLILLTMELCQNNLTILLLIAG